MNLPNLEDIDLAGKRVILRGDLDVDNPTQDDPRIIAVGEALECLLDKGASVVLIGHKGRPDGKIDNALSLEPTSVLLSEMLGKEINFVYDLAGAEAQDSANKLALGSVMMLENLRFDNREESNDENFAKNLSSLGSFYVNEAFASSHREHASIVGIPKFLPSSLGIRFAKEVENLSLVFENPARPLVILVSGIKEDKLEYAKAFTEFADKVLLGGRLPDFMGDEQLVSVRSRKPSEKLIVGNLIMDKEDITLNTIDVFEKEISKAGTVVVSGPLGKYEDDGHKQGTERVLKAIAKSAAKKIAGGGDTENALKAFGVEKDFDWISVGGGAMLEFLSKKTLPGIEAVSRTY